MKRSVALIFTAVLLAQLSSGCCWCHRPLFNRLHAGGPLLGAPISSGTPVISSGPVMTSGPIVDHGVPSYGGGTPGCTTCGSNASPVGMPVSHSGPVGAPIGMSGGIPAGAMMTGNAPPAFTGYPVFSGNPAALGQPVISKELPAPTAMPGK